MRIIVFNRVSDDHSIEICTSNPDELPPKYRREFDYLTQSKNEYPSITASSRDLAGDMQIQVYW